MHDAGARVEERPPGASVHDAGARPERWRTLTRALGEILVTGGLVVLLFAVYEVYITDLFTDHRQGQLTQELHQQWTQDRNTPRKSVLGNAFAVLHIPRIDPQYERAVLQGTAEEELKQGPGHYTGTAMPGQQGNVSFAGHRVGKGSPFLDLDKLRPGDPIVVETADSWFVYRVLGDPKTGDFTTDPSGIPGQEIVAPYAIEVIAPTPDGPSDGAPSGAYLTLTTCHPKYSAHKRLIIHARLDGAAISKAAMPDGPAALNEH